MMKQSAAIYARVSSNQQKEQKTIASQTALLLEHAQKQGLFVPKEWVFEDEGYSGGTLARPGLERLRDLVAEGQVETVLVYGPDRLSRQYAYQVLLLEEFNRHGVQTIFLQSAGGDSPEDRLLVQFQGMIAEYERAQIAERSRRGKRHRAKLGSINVLSGAPYGYRYIRKSEQANAHYEVVEDQASVVQEVFHLYTHDLLSIGAVTRTLNQRGIPTRHSRGRWERSTIWAMLRNPAYQGTACFGKTERTVRRRLTKPLRAKGGFSPRSGAHRERPREQWISIPVPALVSSAAFALAQERLAENKRLSARRTKHPTLLQGLLVCGQCGYGLYRTSTKTTKRQAQYYRCLGSDRYRHLQGTVCSCRPIRQEYLDELIWEEVLKLLLDPALLQGEIQRRLEEGQNSDPVRQRKERLEKELKRVESQLDKLLDAYQEDLLSLAELRRRVPELRRKQATLQKQLQGAALQSLENKRFLELSLSLESFLAGLRQSAQTTSVMDRQKIIRLLIKQITVHADTLTIQHCIPLSGASKPSAGESYALCTWSDQSAISQSLFESIGSVNEQARL